MRFLPSFRRFTRRNFMMIGAGAAAAAFAAGPSLALTPVEAFVKRISDEVIALANSGAAKATLKKQFAALVSRYSDVRSVAMLALGPYRKDLPAGRKEEFIRLVGQYISAFFVYYIEEFQGTGLEIRSSTPQGNATIVEARITKAGPVRWRIASGGGGFRVLDINVRAVWLSLQLKQRFTDVLRRSQGDFDALFAELKSAETW